MRTKFLLNLICGACLIFVSGCGLFDEDSLCGVEKQWFANLGEEYKYESLDFLTEKRIFIFEDLNTPVNICSEEHSDVIFEAIFKEDNTIPSNITVYGKAYWGFYEKEIKLKEINFRYSESLSIGLKQAFPGKPGWIGLQIIFEFPTQGSLALDKEFFQSYVSRCNIVYTYKEHI